MPAAPAAPPTSAPAPASEPSKTTSAPQVGAPGAPKPADTAAVDFDADIESDLESLDQDRPAPAKGAAPKPADKPSGSDKAPGEPPKPADKPSEPVKDAGLPEDRPSPGRIADLRKAYDELKPVVKQLRGEIKSAHDKIQELESRKPADNKPVLEKVTALEKRNAELEAAIRFKDYTKSKEYQEKYFQPYADAYREALSEMGELQIRMRDGDDELGQPKFKTREATEKDLTDLLFMPLGVMYEKAEEMFGRAAPGVINSVKEVRRLFKAQETALQKAQKDSESQSQQAAAMTEQQQKERLRLWGEANESLANKYPKWFKPVEGDQQGNELLQKGFALADRLFQPTADTAPKTPEDTVRLHARIRNKVANHDRLALWLNNANKRIKELESALAEYEKSEPPGGPAGEHKPTPKSWNEEVEAEIEKMDQRM